MVRAASVAEKDNVLRLTIIDVMHFKVAALATENLAALGLLDLAPL
jgi:hypothetical protein